jgi:hypothetical protein
MLKIKDNIDLKELERYGFKYEYNDVGYNPKYEWYEINNSMHIDISNQFKNSRIIQIYNDYNSKFDESVLYDLIIAEMVEKNIK